MTTEMLLEAIGNINAEAVRDAKAKYLANQEELTNRESHLAHRQGIKRRMSKRRLATVLLIVALLLTLTITALAYFGVGEWFKSFFAELSGGELSPKQQQYIDENAVGIGQSETVDGYTVTVNSAICDEQTLYLVISVEGPEGVKLDMPSEEGSIYFDYAKCKSTGTYKRTGHLSSFGGSWPHLDDGDGRENTVTMIMQEQYVMSADSNRVYTDGEIWRLQLADLTTRTGALYDKVTTLAKGGWSFEFPLTKMNGEVEMVPSPVVCVAQSGGEMSKKESVEMKVDSLVLRPFSITLRYSFFPGNRPEAVDMLDVYLVMKDGSKVIAQPRSGGGAGSIGSNGGEMSYIFDAPVMLDEVAYVVLPDDVQVPFPEE